MKQLASFICVLVLSFFAIHDTADALTQYTVTPLVIDMSASARDITKKTLVLTNTGDVPVTVYAIVNNISLKEGGVPEELKSPVESDRTQSLASWIEIRRGGIDIKPGSSTTVEMTLRINPNPVPGTYHARIGFGSGSNQDEARAQVENGKAPAMTLTVTIEENTFTLLKLSRFIVDRFVTKPENQAAVYTFTNPGTETVVPKGEIIIYDGTGKEVGTVVVNEENKEIQPGEEHTFTEQLPVKGLFGKYKAFLSIEYGDTAKGRATVQDTSFFYALPLQTLVTIAVILLILVALLAWYLHVKLVGNDDDDDSEYLTFHIRDSESESKEHDVNLKQAS